MKMLLRNAWLFFTLFFLSGVLQAQTNPGLVATPPDKKQTKTGDQDEKTSTPLQHIVFLELGGSGGLYQVGYTYLFSRDFSIGIGGEFFGDGALFPVQLFMD